MRVTLPYKINDADNHFNEPLEVYERYIDPSKSELAIRVVTTPDGKRIQLFDGRPSKFNSSENHQVTFSKAELEQMLGAAPNADPESQELTDTRLMPGVLLNRLNPLKGLTDEERAEVIAQFREQKEAYGNRDLRLALMDDQGIDKAVMFPNTAHDIEFEFADDLESLYANVRAFNRWIYEEIGYCHQGRMFLPPYLPLADTELSLKELDILLSTGAPMIQIKSGHAHGGRSNPHGGRSPADPVFDPIWAQINEARVGVAAHLGGTDYQKYGADWSEDPNTVFYDFDAFQWMMYWGDKPAMELTAGLILHNFFGRFPNIRVLLSEQGTVWVPYTLRKMDHAFLMGRKAKWAEDGRLDSRPSEIFRNHFLVAPYPEENVQRVVDEVGIEPIVFGSDFPHGEGLAEPSAYVDSQLVGFSEEDKQRIMRSNLEEFLAVSTA
jgi:predicted TIM-barrel fold metal-dependent hydrolase